MGTGGALGTSTATKTIWRAPSASGLKCMSGTTAMTMMGQLVATRTENCPCPTCDTPPANLSTFSPVFVGGTVDLECGVGFTANGSKYSCAYSTLYAGVFATPYPECLPLDPTTTTTTAAPATTRPSRTTAAPVTTTRIENITTYTLKSALTLDFGALPENVT